LRKKKPDLFDYDVRHLTEREQAYYFVGHPIARYLYLRHQFRRPEPRSLALVNWIATWLPPAEKEFVARHAGFNLDEPGRPLAQPIDRKHLDVKSHQQALCLVGKAIILRLRHTDIHRTFDRDIRAVLRLLDHWLSHSHKELVFRHALIDFDAPGRPLPRFSMPPDPEIPF